MEIAFTVFEVKIVPSIQSFELRYFNSNFILTFDFAEVIELASLAKIVINCGLREYKNKGNRYCGSESFNMVRTNQYFYNQLRMEVLDYFTATADCT